ncbi:undecaprenyl/decaprenyl-phosphate alpha-N-acetylglucosaminyl 1-phosphate transferase, partial [bacterium]|nr:undecaprenyl/decaprenyl-phosphate alpha-N-acetylglucosaminyl 1-phosphate transferase [bacterium]
MQLNIYYVAILSIALSGVFNWIILYITKKYSFKKSSLLNEKRLVNKNTPPLGGVASAAAFFISVNFLGDADYNFIIIGGFSLLISILGSIDDFFNLSWKIKLFFQSIFVTIPIIYLNIFLNIESLLNLDLNNSFNFLISVLWVILIINSINFIDNMDGLAVVVTGSICYQSILLTYSLNQNKLTDLSVVLLFVILGFFIYNFPPAKLYLGDSGSLFIGFCLGFLSILFTWN